MTDEKELIFEKDVGVELAATQYARTTLGKVPSLRCAVARVAEGSAAQSAGVKPGWILVTANGASLETKSVDAVAKQIQSATRPLKLVFRDPEAFGAALSPGGESGGKVVTTNVLNSYNGEPQILAVRRDVSPSVCGLGAQRGDLLEVRYEGRLPDGRLFDGSAITFEDGKSVAGRAGDTSLYFVLGAQPVGQFPIAWDPAMTGACVGEVRTVRVPPVIGFQDRGSPRRGVPPYTTVLYTLQLLSINGNYLPR